MESVHGLEMLQLDKDTPAAHEVLHGAIGTESLAAAKPQQASSVVDLVFSGMKDMIHKGMDMAHLVAEKRHDISNLVVTEHAVLVPLETKEGTALVVLDKDTQAADAVLDTLFDGKKAEELVAKFKAQKAQRIAQELDEKKPAKKEEKVVAAVPETSYFEAIQKNAKENMEKAVEGMKKLAETVSELATPKKVEVPALEEDHVKVEEMAAKAKKAAVIKQVLKADLEEAKAKQALAKELQENRQKVGGMADEAFSALMSAINKAKEIKKINLQEKPAKEETIAESINNVVKDLKQDLKKTIKSEKAEELKKVLKETLPPIVAEVKQDIAKAEKTVEQKVKEVIKEKLDTAKNQSVVSKLE